ncbi:MAG: hypothetical protein JNM26_05655 [Ideonella sp.]|nr:hypothetical protein [Ideonella sp.]
MTSPPALFARAAVAAAAGLASPVAQATVKRCGWLGVSARHGPHPTFHPQERP